MEKEKINNLIVDYIRKNLSPTENERKMISGRYDEIFKLLAGNEIFQSGSYARFTSTTPVSDLDIIWVIPRSLIDEKLQTLGLSEKAIDPRRLELSDILSDLAEKLKNEYVKIGQSVNVEPQTHSVCVYFGDKDGFSIDIVPAIRSGDKNEYKDDIYFVPEDKDGSIIWIKSDPKGYIKEAQELNEKNDSFRKCTKFVKKWKVNCKKKNELFPLKSFHLEAISKEIVSKTQDIAVYDSLIEFYTELDFYISEPKFYDRANPQTFIDDYVKELSEEKIELIKKVSGQALDSLEAMEKCNSDSEVIELIEESLSGEEVFSHKISSIFKYALSYFFTPPSWQKPLPWPKIASQRIDIKCFLEGVKEITSKKLLFPNHQLKFVSEYSGPYEEIYWQVVNTGEQAMSIGEHALRGDYFKAKKINGNPSESPFINWERTAYHGSHWINCFAVQGGKCVAVSEPFYVNIFSRSYKGGYRKSRKR